ncbi:MAG TPA: hypothetical protein VMZ73_01915 [Acidimicrobiales bacterium]|nr:hypothetical protein [Acidimicrobiales bacterium]
MDEGLQEPVKATRLLAWLTAGLLIAGGVSAGAVRASNDGADRRIVSAAGGGVAGVDAPTTTTAEVVLPPTTAAPVPASTTTAPAPTTTTRAVPPTTGPRPTTTTTKAPATTTTKAAGVRLTVVNQHPSAVKLTVNGRSFTLAAGEQSGPVAVTRAANGNDVVEVSLVQEPSCGTGDADTYFPKPGDYTMTVGAGPGLCQPGMPGPVVKVTPS